MRSAAFFAEEDFESAAAWRGYDDARLEGVIGAALPKAKSWHCDLTLWGSTERDGIQLWRHRGEVQTIQVRFDLRDRKFVSW